jgi:Na+-transporting methylmalonyl-CoA/oxaloacetate decarboxylase gamma subunit
MDFSKNLSTFYEGLSIMVFGMTGIFLVLLLIFGSIKVLLKLFPPKA